MHRFFFSLQTSLSSLKLTCCFHTSATSLLQMMEPIRVPAPGPGAGEGAETGSAAGPESASQIDGPELPPLLLLLVGSTAAGAGAAAAADS